MLVTKVIGDCPGCNAPNSFGNVSVGHNQLLRGCGRCRYQERIPLPTLNKKVIYLDQFFFSGAFKDKDRRIIQTAERLKDLAHQQLIVLPYSSLHEDESQQWTGYGGKTKDDLMDFIKVTARGHQFVPEYEIVDVQIQRAFAAFLADEQVGQSPEQRDVVRGSLDEWDNYYWVDVGRYLGDVEFIRDIKTEIATKLVQEVFPNWRSSELTFDQQVVLENEEAAKHYLRAYGQKLVSFAAGDMDAVLNAPVASTVVERLLHHLPKTPGLEDKIPILHEFFRSKHFSEVPVIWIESRLNAALRDQVQSGAYANERKAINRLRGFGFDCRHISRFAPYSDAMVVDVPMRELIRHKELKIDERYGLELFSLRELDAFDSWLDSVERSADAHHEAALKLVYP